MAGIITGSECKDAGFFLPSMARVPDVKMYHLFASSCQLMAPDSGIRLDTPSL